MCSLINPISYFYLRDGSRCGSFVLLWAQPKEHSEETILWRPLIDFSVLSLNPSFEFRIPDTQIGNKVQLSGHSAVSQRNSPNHYLQQRTHFQRGKVGLLPKWRWIQFFYELKRIVQTHNFVKFVSSYFL